jgi:hypothetical protein
MGKKREKKDQVLGSFRNLGRGKSAPPQCRASSHLENCTHKCRSDAGMYASCGCLPATNLVFSGRTRILCVEPNGIDRARIVVKKETPLKKMK